MKASYEFKRLKASFLKNRIGSLPDGKFVDYNDRGRIVSGVYIREYPDQAKYNRHRYPVTTETGKRLSALVREREELVRELERITEDMILPETDPYDRSRHRDDEAWERLKASKDSNTAWSKPANAPVFKGVRYRSKSEMTIAMILDEMGLEFVYEPTVYVGGKKKNPDFAVFIREIGRIFLIEHLGKMGDPDYRRKNYEKISLFLDNGFTIGKDILFTFETEDAGIDAEIFFQQINAVVMTLVSGFKDA